MMVKINGAVCEVPENSSVAEMLAARKLPVETVIVLLNDEVVTREEWGSLKLLPDDSLEIVRLIGGG